MDASRARPLTVGNAGNGSDASRAAGVPSGTAVTTLPDSTGVPIVTGVTGVTRWRLVCLLLRDADRVSRRLVRLADRLPARRLVHRIADADPRPAGTPRAQAEVLEALAAGLVERLDCGRYRAASHAREGNE